MTGYSRNQLIDWDKQYFIHPTSSIKQQQAQGAAFVFESGDGIYLKDMDGRVVIDGMSSLWNVNVGHGRRELAEVAAAQMAKLAYSSAFATFSHEPAILLAKKLAELAPGNLAASFFTSGGSESNESAIKLVRHYWRLKGQPRRRKIIARRKAYHGVSSGATSATGIPEFWDMAGVLVPDFVHAGAPVFGNPEYDPAVAGAKLRELIKAEGPEEIAAFMAEPVQGAGGLLFPPEDYFREVRQVCDEYGILFIADEVITGFGRTGKMFGMEHWGVVPDVMSTAKGISSGYVPLGAVLFSERLHRELIELSTATLFHGFTYSGHPTACAVALANLDIIERESLVDNSRVMGERMLKGFEWLSDTFDIVGHTRGRGLLGAFDLLPERDLSLKFPAELGVAGKVVAAAAEKGLIVRSVTYEGANSIVLAPPLIVTEAQIDDIINRLHDAIADVRVQLGI